MITRLITNAQGNHSGWNLGAGGSKPSAMQSDDGDTSYIFDQADAHESYTHQGLPTAATSASSHTLSHKTKRSTLAASATVNGFLRRSGSNTHGASQSLTTSYVLYSDNNILGATPTKAEVNATEIGVRALSTLGEPVFCTWLYWDVTHGVASQGFVLLIAEWLGPVVALGLAEMPGLARELFRRSGSLVQPRELEVAWREVRDHRWPSRFFRPAAGAALWVPAAA